jgi:hypothetical protein
MHKPSAHLQQGVAAPAAGAACVPACCVWLGLILAALFGQSCHPSALYICLQAGRQPGRRVQIRAGQQGYTRSIVAG